MFVWQLVTTHLSEGEAAFSSQVCLKDVLSGRKLFSPVRWNVASNSVDGRRGRVTTLTRERERERERDLLVPRAIDNAI